MRATPMPLPVPGPDRCLVMGILNVTPDSFSDGGRYHDHGSAVRHGMDLWAEGADIIDVGGESTRPGAGRVPVADEIERVVPVIGALAEAGVRVSVDTTRRVVAEAAIVAGAVLVNDVSGGQGDPDLPRFVADAGVDYVLAHSRGASTDMQERADYGDVVGEVMAELRIALEAVCAAGVDRRRVALDPGLGFAKRAEHNWQLLAGLDRLEGLGRPILIGASRKAMLGGTPFGPGSLRRDVEERDGATAAVTAIVAAAGIWAVRVHDVARTVEAVEVAAAIRQAQPMVRNMTWAS